MKTVLNQVNVRVRGEWAQLYPHRGLLLDLFMASGGQLIHQISLQRQLGAFLSWHEVPHSSEALENLTMRIRVMMSHVRDHRRHTIYISKLTT